MSRLILNLIRKEFNCSDVPQLINLIWVQPNDLNSSHIMVAYKNKCELLCEKTGDVLRQFQFNHLATIRSMVELYDNERLEVLVTHSCKKNSFLTGFIMGFGFSRPKPHLKS